MDKEKFMKILKGPPLLGLFIGAGIGLISFILLLIFSEAILYFFYFSIPMKYFQEMSDGPIDNLIGNFISPYSPIVVFAIMFLWYSQFGFYSGLFYWLLRKKFRRRFSILILIFFLVISIIIIFIYNGKTFPLFVVVGK